LVVAAAGLAAGPVGSAAVLFHEEFDGATPYVATPKVITDKLGPDQQEIDGRELNRDSWLDFRNRVKADAVGGREVREGYVIAETPGRETVLSGVMNHPDVQIWATFVKDLFPDLAQVRSVTVRLRVDKNRNGVFDDAQSGPDVSVVLYGLRTDTPTEVFFHQALTKPRLVREADGFFTAHFTGIDMTRGGLATGSLRALRVDPLQGPPSLGVPFEIDYVRIEDGREEAR
jgi:hypothetical protein